MANSERADSLRPSSGVQGIDPGQISQPFKPEFEPSLQRATCDLIEFGLGAVIGAIDGTSEFIEFMATPNAVNKALLGFGPVLDEAVTYYAGHLMNGSEHKMVSDARSAIDSAGEWLIEYGRRPPSVRGRVCGKMMTDFLFLESGVSITKGLLSATEASFCTKLLESRSATLDNFMNGLQGAEGIGFKEIKRFGASRKFAEQIDSILERSPERWTQFLRDKGVEVVPVRKLDALGADCANILGLYIPAERVIFIAEEPHAGFIAAGFGNSQRTQLTVSHEVGHAIDHCSRANQWLSSTDTMRRAFEADFASMPRTFQEVSLRDFGQGSMERLRKEIFAELFSHSAVPTADPLTRDFVFANFPRMYKTMGEMEECAVRRLRLQK